VYISADVPNRTDISVPVYGRVPAGQDVTAGAYADTVSVIVNF
jgi:spore coat protein U-like protein